VNSALSGLGSFLSQCNLPVLPAFVSYLSGTTISDIQNSSPGTTITSEIKGINSKSRNVIDVGQQQGSIFSLANTSPGTTYNSLLAYSLGLGVPLLITGAFFSRSTGLIRRIVKHLKYFNPAMGAILIVVGILVFTDQYVLLGNFQLANQIAKMEGNFFGD